MRAGHLQHALCQCEECAGTYATAAHPAAREIHLLPEEVQRTWRKGRRTTSTKTKAIHDPEGLRQRIRDEKARLRDRWHPSS
jgi:hypothetical protein